MTEKGRKQKRDLDCKEGKNSGLSKFLLFMEFKSAGFFAISCFVSKLWGKQ